MRARITHNVSVTAVAILLSIFGITSATAQANISDSATSSSSICQSEIPKAVDQERNSVKVEKLTSDITFQKLSWKINSTPEILANDVATYFTEDEVDHLFIDGFKNGNDPAKTTLEMHIAPPSIWSAIKLGQVGYCTKRMVF